MLHLVSVVLDSLDHDKKLCICAVSRGSRFDQFLSTAMHVLQDFLLLQDLYRLHFQLLMLLDTYTKMLDVVHKACAAVDVSAVIVSAPTVKFERVFICGCPCKLVVAYMHGAIYCNILIGIPPGGHSMLLCLLLVHTGWRYVTLAILCHTVLVLPACLLCANRPVCLLCTCSVHRLHFPCLFGIA